MKKIIYTLVLLGLVILSGCESYVNGVDPLIDRVSDPRLTAENQIDFQIIGVQQRFSVAASQIGFATDLLADMMEYTGDNPSASFPTFEEIDKGYIALGNTSVDGFFSVIQGFRFYADTLIDRTAAITFTSTTLRDKAYFTGYFYGAVARFWLGTSFGLTEKVPGSPINVSAVIPGATLVNDAITRAKKALTYTTDAYTKKMVNSIIAKMYLSLKDYPNATTHALLGLKKGDADFTALKNSVTTAYHWGFGGAGRVQAHVAEKYNDYVKADPKEAARIKLVSFLGTSKKTYYRQDKYPLQESAYIVMTWKENNLMLAELALRGQATAGNALTLVNEVRTAYGIGNLTAIDLDGIYIERDKELFCQGTRHMDMIRFDKWHLAADTWKYMPIPLTERDANPNF